MGGHDHFEGKEESGDENQYKLFGKKLGFEYFSCNNFFKKKKKIFFKLTPKNNF